MDLKAIWFPVSDCFSSGVLPLPSWKYNFAFKKTFAFLDALLRKRFSKLCGKPYCLKQSYILGDIFFLLFKFSETELYYCTGRKYYYITVKIEGKGIYFPILTAHKSFFPPL